MLFTIGTTAVVRKKGFLIFWNRFQSVLVNHHGRPGISHSSNSCTKSVLPKLKYVKDKMIRWNEINAGSCEVFHAWDLSLPSLHFYLGISSYWSFINASVRLLISCPNISHAQFISRCQIFHWFIAITLIFIGADVIFTRRLFSQVVTRNCL